MSTTNPRYAEICALLDQLVNWPKDQSILGAPHGVFWRTGNNNVNYVDLTTFLQITTDSWGVPGKLVTLGNASQSNLHLALSGTTPFDGENGPPQMPDTGSDPGARHATSDEQTMVQTWINNGAPA
jgi:hypothetical protein